MNDGPLAAGRLLVATPAIEEPIFRRTVVMLLAHGPEGALGVVLNRPSTTPLAEVLPEWAPAAAAPADVFVGGPVGAGSAIGLARLGDLSPAGAWSALVGLVGTLDLEQSPSAVGDALDQVRVFAGYAGWSAGQLEGEISEGGWWVIDSWADDAFHAAPGDLWRQVLRRQGGTLARVANFPNDLRDN